MMLAQCGAGSCDWRATPAHEEAPALGENRGLGFRSRWHLYADHEAVRYQCSSTTALRHAVTCGQHHKGKSAPTEADALPCFTE
jgi:hypothetical protein